MRIYVCSPYRADTPEGIAANVEYARKCCRTIFDAGHDPYAPHLLFPQFCEDSNEVERNKCMTAALRELLLCDGMMVFGDFMSEGMVEEFSFANTSGIPSYLSARAECPDDITNAIELFKSKSTIYAQKQENEMARRGIRRELAPNVLGWRKDRNPFWGDLP